MTVLVPDRCLSIYFRFGVWLCFVTLARYKNRKDV